MTRSLYDYDFPHVNTVDVMRWPNDFDYSRYDSPMMRISLLSVPWDNGEAHIGNRVIEGVGNVVKFDDDEARDAWFDAAEKLAFLTNYRSLHSKDKIKVPVPWDVMMDYNYVMVEYMPITSGEEPIEHEKPEAARRLFFFARALDDPAPNCTTVELLRDTWTTIINTVELTDVMLERGHYAMLDPHDGSRMLTPSEYLDNPPYNNAFLLEDDVTGREPSLVMEVGREVVLDSDTIALVTLSSSPVSDWGTIAGGTWRTPTLDCYAAQGVPSAYTIACPPSAIPTFLANANANMPNVLQTILGICFCSRKYVDVLEQFGFCGVQFVHVQAVQHVRTFVDLTPSMFDYPEPYDKLVKLYTAPYAYLGITTTDGRYHRVAIETSGGRLELGSSASLAYPNMLLDFIILGIGNTNTSDVTFRTMNNRGFRYSGKWYELDLTFEFPVYAVYQSAERYNWHDEYYDRAQSDVVAQAAKDKADNQASNASTCAINSGNAATANAAVATAASTAITETNASAAGDGVAYTHTKMAADYAADVAISSAAYHADMDGLAVASQVNDMQATQGFWDTLGAVLSLDVGGALSTGTGAAAQWSQNSLTNAVSQSNSQSIYSTTISANANKYSAATSYGSSTTYLQNETMRTNTDTSNSATIAQAANAAGATIANGWSVNGMMSANGAIDKATENAAKANRLAGRNIEAPRRFGEFSGWGLSTVRPQAIMANVEKMDSSAVRSVGSQWMRYGYMLNQLIEFDDFRVMPYATYWKLSGYNTKGGRYPDEYVDELRLLLMGGVTVWSSPEYIGSKTFAENLADAFGEGDEHEGYGYAAHA